jgi:hypothetical protein
VKINVDTSFCADQGRGSASVIISDFKGKFIATHTKDLPFVVDVITAEAYALRVGLLLAQYMRCNRFTIQYDNTEVV